MKPWLAIKYFQNIQKSFFLTVVHIEKQEYVMNMIYIYTIYVYTHDQSHSKIARWKSYACKYYNFNI